MSEIEKRIGRRRKTGILVTEKSPPWFRGYFGEHWTGRIAGGGRPCRHCGRSEAMAAPCYQGLCNDCWTALLFHCLEEAKEWIDGNPGEWSGDEKPDTLERAVSVIAASVRKGGFDDLLAVAIDGADPGVLARRRNREYSRRYYQRHREACLERHRRYMQEHPEQIREYQRAYYARNREKRLAANRAWMEKNRGKRLEYMREYRRKRGKGAGNRRKTQNIGK